VHEARVSSDPPRDRPLSTGTRPPEARGWLRSPQGATHRAEREPLLRATGENSPGEPAAATTPRFFLQPGRERGLGAALPRFLRADPPGVRGEAGADGNMAVAETDETTGACRALPPGAG